MAAMHGYQDATWYGARPQSRRLRWDGTQAHGLYNCFQVPTAIIALLKTITDLLSSEPYVIVISLDFSKAFDTVRHSSLLHKFAQLNNPDYRPYLQLAGRLLLQPFPLHLIP